MPSPNDQAHMPPTLYMPGETVLVEAVVVTALAIGCRLRVPGITPGLTNYFCTEHRNMRKMGQETRR